MKMMRKRQLLGIAAVLAAVSSAQTADAQVAFRQTRDTVSIAECDSENNSDAIISGNLPYNTLIVTNSGTAKVYVTTGKDGATAVAGTHIPILPDSQVPIGIPQGHTHVACITASGTAAVEFTPGIGN